VPVLVVPPHALLGDLAAETSAPVRRAPKQRAPAICAR
jgi:hypothetical protein